MTQNEVKYFEITKGSTGSSVQHFQNHKLRAKTKIMVIQRVLEQLGAQEYCHIVHVEMRYQHCQMHVTTIRQCEAIVLLNYISK